MSRIEFKESKPLTLVLAICLAVILASTFYVALTAFKQHRSGKDYRHWNEELGPVAVAASDKQPDTFTSCLSDSLRVIGLSNIIAFTSCLLI